MKIPLKYERESFEIDQTIITNKYVELSKNPAIGSVQFNISGNNEYLYGYNYKVQFIKKANLDFILVPLYKSIITWKVGYVIEGIPLTASDIGKVISIMYVESTEQIIRIISETKKSLDVVTFAR